MSNLAIVAIEAVLLLGIAVPLWAKNVNHFPDPKDATVIQIVAQQVPGTRAIRRTGNSAGRT